MTGEAERDAASDTGATVPQWRADARKCFLEAVDAAGRQGCGAGSGPVLAALDAALDVAVAAALKPVRDLHGRIDNGRVMPCCSGCEIDCQIGCHEWPCPTIDLIGES